MDPLDVYEKQAGLILAAEEWAKIYKKDTTSFGQLVKAEAKINRVMVEYFKGLLERVEGFVNWNLYNHQLTKTTAAITDPFQVDVIVTEVPDNENGLVMQIIYDPIALAVEAGLAASEAAYGVVLPEEAISDVIARVARSNTAFLVGKRIDKSGNIVDNPNAEYRISDATRDKIRQSIRTSLSLGEDQATAVKRLLSSIKGMSAKRAEKIASTEAVNGYQGGQLDYAKQTGAVMKEWQALLGACPICLGNVGDGPIPITEKFSSGHIAPSAHPGDRCGLRYIYQEELDQAKN